MSIYEKDLCSGPRVAQAEAPQTPELLIDTGKLDIGQSVHGIIDHVERSFTLNQSLVRVA